MIRIESDGLRSHFYIDDKEIIGIKYLKFEHGAGELANITIKCHDYNDSRKEEKDDSN